MALAQAELGIVPNECAARIAAAASSDGFDMDALSKAIEGAQHPFAPVLKRLEELCGEPAAGYVHLGATTQNIFDTAMALLLMRTHQRMTTLTASVLQSLRRLAGEHADTLQVGRTHGQHALPMTFGFKVAGWADEVERDRTRLIERAGSSCVASFGGAIGTSAALGAMGPETEQKLAARLGLEPAGLAMRSSFDRVTDYVAGLALFAATAEKIAQDVVFMQRTEVREVAEAHYNGKVGSSTMAQKRNPSTALTLISLARLLRARVALCLESMVRMDEGDSSATNVADVTVPEIAMLAASVAAKLDYLVSGLKVNPAAMRSNLSIAGGLVVTEALTMALHPRTGRHAAHDLMYELAQQAQEQTIRQLQGSRQLRSTYCRIFGSPSG